MEEISDKSKSSQGKLRFWFFLGAAVLVTGMVFLSSFFIMGKPLSLKSRLRRDLPRIDVDVKLVGLTGELLPESVPFPSALVRRASSASAKSKTASERSVTRDGNETADSQEASQPAQQSSPQPTSNTQTCETVVGGDFTSGVAYSDNARAYCPGRAEWKVISHPLIASLVIRRGADVWKVLNTSQGAFDSPVLRGMALGVMQLAKVRADDWGLSGVKGLVVERLLKEALRSGAEVHYDLAHAKRGWILSYDLKNANLNRRLLPLIVGRFARSVMVVTGLREPLIEVQLASQRVWISQVERRVVVSMSAEALINYLNQYDGIADSIAEGITTAISDSASGGTKHDVTLIWRAQSYLQGLIPILSDAESWEVALGLTLKDGRIIPENLYVPATRGLDSLSSIAQGDVLRAVPSNIFAGVVIGAAIPLDRALDSWRRYLGMANDVDTGHVISGHVAGESDARSLRQGDHRITSKAVAFLWDLEVEESALKNSVGLAVELPIRSSGETAREKFWTDAEGMLAKLFSGKVFRKSCSNLVLVASTENLLAKMQASCFVKPVVRVASSDAIPGNENLANYNLVGDHRSIGELSAGDGNVGSLDAKLLVYLNSGLGLLQIYTSGVPPLGGSEEGEVVPDWKKDYDNRVKEAGAQVAGFANGVPRLVFSGDTSSQTPPHGMKLKAVLVQ